MECFDTQKKRLQKTQDINWSCCNLDDRGEQAFQEKRETSGSIPLQAVCGSSVRRTPYAIKQTPRSHLQSSEEF